MPRDNNQLIKESAISLRVGLSQLHVSDIMSKNNPLPKVVSLLSDAVKGNHYRLPENYNKEELLRNLKEVSSALNKLTRNLRLLQNKIEKD